ncbi:ankyrin-2-like isoform X12 [Synchiropus splendidus]|uniref:ankyrin-2-like isoform X12 n=1 Tax=Synchiropus splendidus TaxID=270530 RepID=UPI00237E86F0|nr:ankyrin-2-like isoform X12 [Synchiropus splendidus]
MAHAAAHIKKARSEMDQPPDLKALEKAKERRRRSRERAERRRKLDSNTSFLRAARAGNIEKVVEYLKGGVDIRTCNQNGLNALHLAAKEGHMNLVLELLDRGAVVDAATKKGNTALHISSLAGQAEVAKTLVINGADINAQSQNGFTPLYMAAQENHIDVVRYLLENGGNQSTATEDGFTPLAIALQQGHNQVVSILLENDTKGKVRLPALHIAARKDDTKSAALLLQNDHNADIQSKMMVNRTTEPLLSKQFCTQLSCTKSDLHCQNGKSGFTPLHIAAHYGNVNVATLLLNRGAAVDFSARNGITPLHVASKRGNTNMVRLLLDRGSQIDAKTRDGLTPLHCASRSGHSMVVELLLEREAPLFARTKNGLSALHMAAQGDHVECVKHILKKAPVDDVTLDYLTALHVSAHCGHYRVTKLLLDKMANPNARALNGFTPLHIACKKNRVKVMELLVKYGASIQAITESGLTPIHVAAFMGHLNIVLLLLQHGASPDASNIRGETSVHMAARAGQVEVVRCLLRNGAQVDATARENQTPLHIASRLGKADIVQLLLQHMANPDAATANGYTALHITAREGQVGTALVLLEAGASHSLATKKGFTPLHIAAKYGSLDVAELLLQCCAASDSAGKSGLTPLHVAAHYDNQRVALLLLDKGASPHAMAKNGYTPLHIAAKKNQMEIATVLVKYGAETNIQTKQGVTPLHLASEQGHDHMASLLLSNGAQVNIPTKVMYRRKSTCNVTELLINTIPVFLQSGLTALHLAAQEEKVAVAKILVSYGANINEPTKLQYSPLIVASHYGNVKMVNFLLQKGADVLAKTKNGYTALHQAAQQGNTHIINVLLQYGAKPDAVTANGNTALGIARRLGYISVVDTLRVITEETITTTTTVTEKHKLNVPETMTEVLDVSDEEGDDTITGDGRDYLRAEDLQELGDDSLPGQYGMNYLHFNPLGVYTESHQGPCRPSTKRDGVLDDMITSHHEERNSYDVGCGTENPDNVVLSLSPVSTGFLVSFMVDARGGAMCGCRQNGLRIIIPPKKCSAPTRVTCRLVKRHRLATMPPMLKGDSLSSRLVEVGTSGPKFLGKLHLPSTPPPLNEGESLVSRILQLGPPGTKFLGPVVVEIPHFASLRGKERELVILRSDTGESWKEHHSEHTHEELHLMLKGMNLELDKPDSLQRKRICIIVTRDFPQYFAVVSRVKQDCSFIGPEGGVLSSSVVPKVQAVFPAGALTKRIKVGLQAQPANKDLVQKVLGNKAILSPIVTLEPRRRKFHKPISMTIPVPKSSSDQGCKDYVGERPTLRLLCSITGGTTPAQWEDITGTTPLTFVNDCISFTTNVSARFWLIDCRQVLESVTYATQVYRKVICVPYMARFVVFAKIHDSIEARLRCFCVTDDKIDKTLEHQENFAEVARSREVEVLEGEPIYADCFGNLVPLTKSGQHHLFNFFAFKENRLALFVKVRDNIQEPCGRLCFTKEPRNRSPTGNSICNLNINLDSRCQDPDSDQLDETRRTQVKCLHEESRKKEVDKHAAAYITSGEPHVQQTEVKTHSEEAEDEQLDVIVINENRLSMHIGHSLWKTRETIEDGRELLVNNIDKTICNISDEKQEETKRPKPIENSAKEQNIQTESRGVTAVISADFVPCATQDELRDLNLALGDGSLEITPQTTPGRTPTEESTPNSEPSSFLFQEGKLFEMTRSGAIDMTKRNYEEEGPGFAFFQIGEQPFEEIQDNEQAVRSAASPPQVGLNLTLQFKEQEHDNLKRKTTSQPVVDVDIPCKREASECKMPEMCNFGTGSSITLNQITTRDGAVEINAFESSYESIIEHIHTTETTVVRALPPEHSLEEAQAAVQASTPLGMPKQSTSCGTTKIPDKIQAKSVYHSRANYTNASPSKKDSSSGAVSKSKIPIKVNYAKPDLHIKCSESKQHKKDKAAIKMDTRRKSVTEEGSALDVKTKTLSSKSQSFCKEDLTKSSPTKSTGSPTTVHSTSSRRFQSKLPLRHKSVLSATSQTPPKHSSDFLKQNSFSMEEISGKEQLTLAKTEHELLKTGAHSGLIDTSFLVSDSCSKAQDTSSGDIFPSRVVQYPSKPQMHQIPDDKVQSQALYGKSAQSGSSVTIIPDEEVQSSLLCLQQTAAPSATDVTPTDCLNNIQLGSLQVHSEPKHTPKAGCEEFNDLVPEEGATLNPDV